MITLRSTPSLLMLASRMTPPEDPSRAMASAIAAKQGHRRQRVTADNALSKTEFERPPERIICPSPSYDHQTQRMHTCTRVPDVLHNARCVGRCHVPKSYMDTGTESGHTVLGKLLALLLSHSLLVIGVAVPVDVRASGSWQTCVHHRRVTGQADRANTGHLPITLRRRYVCAQRPQT